MSYTIDTLFSGVKLL